MTPMLSCVTLPDAMTQVVEAVRGAFTAPSFTTFTELLDGMLRATGEHTVTGMWIAAGLAGRRHWARGHRFFAQARWEPDTLGLLLARLVVSLFAPAGPLTVVVDDTLFPRYGKKVHGAAWQHDGSAKGRDGIGYGTCFVICGLAVDVPFMDRKVHLPLLFRLHVPKQQQTKTEAARTMVGLLARAFPERRIDVVADAAYRGKAWQSLPGSATFTTRLAANAVLYARAPQPDPTATRKRGHPVWRGPRLGSLAQIAADATWHSASVTTYGTATTIQYTVIDALWWGSLHRTAVRVVLTRGQDSKKTFDFALVSTDLAAGALDLVIRYSWRWPIEQTIKDCKLLLGTGDARNRMRRAVERTVPFQMLCLTILFCWYQQNDAKTDLAARRAQRPWYPAKTRVSVDDMLIAYRRARINLIRPAQTAPTQTPDPALNSGLAVAA
jgi:SRSO17 transposase